MRKSKNTDAQKHDRQELALREYAKANNFTIDEFVTDSVSGMVNTDKRENYSSLKYSRGDYGKITASSFAKMLGIGRSTLYKYIRVYEQAAT